MAEEVNLFYIAQKREHPTERVIFEKENQTTLSTKEKEDIDKFVRKMSDQGLLLKIKRGEYLIKIDGFASSSASKEHNKKIAAYRISSVQTYLLSKHNFDVNWFAVTNYGKETAKEGIIDSVDRRVVMKIVAKN